MERWGVLRDAIQKIYDHKASSLSYEELYRTAYVLTLNKYGEMLYDNVKKATADMLLPIAHGLSHEVADDSLLGEITDVWKMQKDVMQKIRDILLYLDKSFVTKQKNLPNVYNMQTNQFKNHVIYKGNIKKRLVALLLSEIERERNGERIEKTNI
mmetsp:Transcript_13170/g.20491  ORF Transcript_13170/g.20491 Transcript_13170/m.20491 type:complete len:155 (+) Transcript_13170:106-570(+)